MQSQKSLSMLTLYKKIFDKKPSYNNDIRDVFIHCRKFRKEISATEIIDIGSGRGIFESLELPEKEQLYYTCIDLDNFLREDIFNSGLIEEFYQINLNNRIEIFKFLQTNCQLWHLAICQDVLEHLYEESLESVIDMMSVLAPYSFIAVSNHSDKIAGVELHLVQKGVGFWKTIIEKRFEILECNILRDITFSFKLKSRIFP